MCVGGGGGGSLVHRPSSPTSLFCLPNIRIGRGMPGNETSLGGGGKSKLKFVLEPKKLLQK